jgi:dCTP deaminase
MKSVECGTITILPFSAEQLNPNSYNYRLGPKIHRLTSDTLDMLAEDDYEEIAIDRDGIVLLPGECYLGHTIETFGSTQYASLITGRSSVGRKFITNHITAGLIDVGFLGEITLEITVQKPTRVYPYLPFGQIVWFSLNGPPPCPISRQVPDAGRAHNFPNVTRRGRRQDTGP